MMFENLVKNIKPLGDTNADLCKALREYCYPILGCCQQVHREMGPFLNYYCPLNIGHPIPTLCDTGVGMLHYM